ncbi:MAG TPA: glycoside hydrolase family 95 protein, partial [Pyrinomonadaceae bacterium]|nr:glycoside hydrolase family 95 protein [Pyrinomonadaceae bacterium]
MKITRREFLSTAGLAAASIAFPRGQTEQPLVLWYDEPEGPWTDGLPIGNGRLGAMVFADPEFELLQLNEDTLYAGRPYDPNNPEALKALPEVRRLIFAGRYREAHDLVGAKMMARPLKQMPYQPVGMLRIAFTHGSITSYRRQLDLNTAIASVSYKDGPVTFTREAFASPVDQVIVVSLTADHPGRVSFTTTFESAQEVTVSFERPDTLALHGVNSDAFGILGGLKFEARVHVLARGGQSLAQDKKIAVTGADSALLLISAATSYRNYKDTSGDPAAMAANHLLRASRKSLESLRAAHVREH